MACSSSILVPTFDETTNVIISMNHWRLIRLLFSILQTLLGKMENENKIERMFRKLSVAIVTIRVFTVV